MMNDILTTFQQLMANPMQMLAKRFNVPANLNDPQVIIQHLLDTGQISQEQVNNAMQMRNNPMFRGLFK